MGRAWSAAHFALFFDLLSTKLLAVEIFSDNEAVIFLLKNRTAEKEAKKGSSYYKTEAYGGF